MVTGGDQAYGPGLYARTPLEDLLPVQTDQRGSSLQAGVGLLLVIDTSGSMSHSVGGTTIMDLAKQAALATEASVARTWAVTVNRSPSSDTGQVHLAGAPQQEHQPQAGHHEREE